MEDTTPRKKNKQLNRNSTMGGKKRKAERRASALARKDEFDKLSLKQKLASLPPEGANRQRARYEALIAKQADAQKDKEKAKRKKEQQKETVAQ